MSLQKKGKKGDGVEDLARAADQFWSDVSKKRKSLQSPTFTQDKHTHPTHSTRSPIQHSQSSVRTQHPTHSTQSPILHSQSSVRTQHPTHSTQSLILHSQSSVRTQHPTHSTQSPILHSQSSVRTQNPRYLTDPPTSHSSTPDNNSRNFQHQSLDHGTKHSSRTLNTSHSPASTLIASKTQPSRYSVNITNTSKRPSAPASLPDPSLVTAEPRATLPSVQENEPPRTKIMDYVVSMFRKFQAQLDRMEKNQNRIEETLKEIQQRKGRPARIREPPGCFPFTVLDNLLNFGDVDQQTYDNVVSHFIYLGGMNPTDSAGHYFKCAFGDNEDVSSHITWLGTKCQHALKGTRFAEACEDAMAQNPNYRRPGSKEFGDAMSRALKSTKERRRKHLVAANADNRRRQRDLTNDAEEDVQPVRRRRLESPIRDDESPEVADLESTDFAIDETEDHSEVDEQHPYEESAEEDLDYEESYKEKPLNEEDRLNEGIAGQQQTREDFLDYSLTVGDLARIDEFDRQKKQKN